MAFPLRDEEIGDLLEKREQIDAGLGAGKWWEDQRVLLPRMLETVRRLRDRVTLLEDGIRKVRDEFGDDRCWRDLMFLYCELLEGFTMPSLQLMPVEEGLVYCRRYLESFHHPQVPYVSPQREIERLQDMLKRLLDALDLSAKPKGTAVRKIMVEARIELAAKTIP